MKHTSVFSAPPNSRAFIADKYTQMESHEVSSAESLHQRRVDAVADEDDIINVSDITFVLQYPEDSCFISGSVNCP